MNLVELPLDILLHILNLLHVHDILTLERTCSALRLSIASRHLWLLKLQSLDQPCAPDLPRYANVEQLSCPEIRGVVTRAIRWLEICKKGMAASSKTRLSSAQLEEQRYSPIHSLYGLPVRLAPGGKLLVINHRGFTAIDVQTGRCICRWGESVLIPAAAQCFALHAPSENSLMILHGFVEVKTGTIILNIFRLEYQPGAEVRVVKIAAYECPSEPRSLAFIFDVALDSRFGVASISKNHVSTLLLWNWQSGQVVETSLERGLRLGNLQISNGWLFYMLTKSIGDRQIKLGTLALSELTSLWSSVVNLNDIQASCAILDRPSGIERLCGVLNLALYDLSANYGLSKMTQLCVMIEVEVVDSEMPHIIAYRYTFDLQNAADRRTSSLHLVHHTEPRTYNSPAFEEPTLRVDGAGDRSGKIVHVSARVSSANPHRPGILYPVRECLLVGIDEHSELFFAPVSQRPWEGLIKTFIDDYGGGMVRLVVRNGATHIDVHYIS